MSKPPATAKSLQVLPKQSVAALKEFIEKAGGVHFWAVVEECERRARFRPGTLYDTEHQQHYTSGYGQGFSDALKALANIAKEKTQEDEKHEKDPSYSDL